jgi:hypothetical protein
VEGKGNGLEALRGTLNKEGSIMHEDPIGTYDLRGKYLDVCFVLLTTHMVRF